MGKTESMERLAFLKAWLDSDERGQGSPRELFWLVVCAIVFIVVLAVAVHILKDAGVFG